MPWPKTRYRHIHPTYALRTRGVIALPEPAEPEAPAAGLAQCIDYSYSYCRPTTARLTRGSGTKTRSRHQALAQAVDGTGTIVASLARTDEAKPDCYAGA